MSLSNFLHDTFTNTDGTGLGSHTSDSGGSWTEHPTLSPSAAGAIQSNQAYGGNAASYWYSDEVPHTEDYSVQAHLDLISSTTNGVGVLARLSSTTSDYYALLRSSTAITLVKSVAGSTTTLGTVTRSSEDCVIELKVEGTTISAYVVEDASGDYVNSSGTLSSSRVACISVTDTSITDKGHAGIQLADTTSTTGTHIDWIRGWGDLLFQEVKDSFTAANGTALSSHSGETGTAYDLHPESDSGVNVQIIDNEVADIGGAGRFDTFYLTDTPPSTNDYVVRGSFRPHTLSFISTNEVGLLARFDPVDIDGYKFQIRRNQVKLGKHSGSFSTFDPFNKQITVTWDITDTYDAYLEVQGSTIEAYLYRQSDGKWLSPSTTETWEAERQPWFSDTDGSPYTTGRAGFQVSPDEDFAANKLIRLTDFEVQQEEEPPPSHFIEFAQSVFGELNIERPALEQEIQFGSSVTELLIQDDRQVPESDLNLTDVAFSPSHPATAHELGISDSVSFFLLTPQEETHDLNLSSTAIGAVGVPWLPIEISHELDLTQSAYKVFTESVNHSLGLSSEVDGSYSVEDSLTLTQTVVAALDRRLEHELGFSQTVSRGLSIYPRSISHNLNLTSAGLAYDPNDKCQTRYGNRQIRSSNGKLTLNSEDGQYSIVLKNPEQDDRRRTSFERVLRETRGGNLVVYRDPSWPTIQTLLFTIVGLKAETFTSLQSFLTNTLGQQIVLTDWLGDRWLGVVTRPDETFVEDRDGFYTFGFEFEGYKTDNKGSNQFLGLTSTATATVV